MSGDWRDVLHGEAEWAVVEGDCREVLAAMPERSVEHVVTDPPYEAEAHTKARRQDAGHVAREYEIPFAPLTEEVRSDSARLMVRASRGWVLAFCQVEAVAAWRAALAAGGGSWRRAMAWVKPDGSPQFTGDRPAQGYECIATAWAGDGRSRWNAGGRRGVYEACVNEYGRLNRPHPTSKPLVLMDDLIRDFTDPGDIVLDPFCGSGTTGVACLRLGRRFVGVEVNATWAALSRERLAAESSGLTLTAARAGQAPLFGEVPLT